MLENEIQERLNTLDLSIKIIQKIRGVYERIDNLKNAGDTELTEIIASYNVFGNYVINQCRYIWYGALQNSSLQEYRISRIGESLKLALHELYDFHEGWSLCYTIRQMLVEIDMYFAYGKDKENS